MNRREFQLSAEQVERLRRAREGGDAPTAGQPQENEHVAWQAIAAEAGFKWHSVRSVEGKGPEFVSAEPVEGGE